MQRTIVTLLILLAGVASLRAQSEDARVSAPDQSIWVLPTSAKIQASLTHGDRTLIVWGGSELDSTGSVIPVLVAQVVRDTVAIGVPTRFTSKEGRPGVHVGIAQMGDVFLVLWRDTRSVGPGVYFTRIDSLGVPLGPELRLAGGLYYTDSLFPVRMIGDTIHGGRLFWRSESQGNGMYSIRLDWQGHPMDMAQYMGPGQMEFLQYTSIPALWIGRPVTGPCVIVASDGTMPYDTVSRGRFDASHCINDDSSLISLQGNTLVYYRHFLDPLPNKTLGLPVVDSSDGQTGMIALDSGGVVRVVTVTFNPANRNPVRNQIYPEYGSYVYRTIKETRVFSDRTIDSSRVIVYDSAWNGGTDFWTRKGSFTHFNRASSRGGSYNTSMLQWIYNGEYYNRDQVVSQYSGVEVISLDIDGNLHLNDGGFMDPGAGVSKKSVQRQPADTESAVVFTSLNRKVRLAVSIARYDSNIAERLPGLISREGEMYVSWMQPEFSSFPRISRWNPDGSGVFNGVDTLNRLALDPISPPLCLSCVRHIAES